jgi:hypothetical protein
MVINAFKALYNGLWSSIRSFISSQPRIQPQCFRFPTNATRQLAYVTGASSIGCLSIARITIDGGSSGHVLVVYPVVFSLNARLMRIIGSYHRVSSQVA